jgi:hypothetical protein
MAGKMTCAKMLTDLHRAEALMQRAERLITPIGDRLDELLPEDLQHSTYDCYDRLTGGIDEAKDSVGELDYCIRELAETIGHRVPPQE